MVKVRCGIIEKELYGDVSNVFAASIMGGLALNNYIPYSAVAGYGLGTLFLLCSTLFLGKIQHPSKKQ